MAAKGGATTTGAKEYARVVDRLPTTVTAALREVAQQSAGIIHDHAQELLNQQTDGTGATAAAIKVVEDAANKQFHVISEAPPDKPDNLVIWLEHGTRFMAARPYMRPAIDHEREPYRRAGERAASQVLQGLR
jgi:hypothetical protein